MISSLGEKYQWVLRQLRIEEHRPCKYIMNVRVLRVSFGVRCLRCAQGPACPQAWTGHSRNCSTLES